jgi:hypothetical protein
MQPAWSDVEHIYTPDGETSPSSDINPSTSMPDLPSPDHQEQVTDSTIIEGHLKVVNDLAEKIVAYCKDHNVEDPVEILRYFQQVMVEGRSLRIQDSGRIEEGETSFILVDRFNILETALEEVKALTNLRKTLEVQFYGEVSSTHNMYVFIIF